MSSWVLKGIEQTYIPSVRAGGMMQALSLSLMVRHILVWSLYQLPSVWCKSVASEARWSMYVIIVK